MDPMSVAEVKIDDPCFWRRVNISSKMETCPCSSQRIARPGVDFPGPRGKLEAVRGKPVVAASLNAGTGLAPATRDTSSMRGWR